jgi:hypothetical protein
MVIKPATAKVTNLDAAFDAAPIETTGGPAIWATVTIDYRLDGLTPTVSIRVPIPWNEHETEAERRGAALRCARQLIDHACRAAGVRAWEAESAADLADEILPAALEGIAQELGLATPATRSRRRSNS